MTREGWRGHNQVDKEEVALASSLLPHGLRHTQDDAVGNNPVAICGRQRRQRRLPLVARQHQFLPPHENFVGMTIGG